MGKQVQNEYIHSPDGMETRLYVGHNGRGGTEPAAIFATEHFELVRNYHWSHVKGGLACHSLDVTLSSLLATVYGVRRRDSGGVNYLAANYSGVGAVDGFKAPRRITAESPRPQVRYRSKRECCFIDCYITNLKTTISVKVNSYIAHLIPRKLLLKDGVLRCIDSPKLPVRVALELYLGVTDFFSSVGALVPSNVLDLSIDPDTNTALCHNFFRNTVIDDTLYIWFGPGAVGYIDPNDPFVLGTGANKCVMVAFDEKHKDIIADHLWRWDFHKQDVYTTDHAEKPYISLKKFICELEGRETSEVYIPGRISNWYRNAMNGAAPYKRAYYESTDKGRSRAFTQSKHLERRLVTARGVDCDRLDMRNESISVGSRMRADKS